MLTWLLALGLLLPPSSADVTVTITSETPEQRQFVESILEWEELPPLHRPIRINVGPGGNFASCGGIQLSTVSQEAFLHEYGHVWDCQRLFYNDRIFLMACLDLNCNTLHDSTWKARDLFWNARPVEQFADVFAAVVLERHYPDSSYSAWGGFTKTLVSRIITFRTHFPCPHQGC